ncbi:MAG: hypothetical protein FJ095_15770 [Deltaproteobacteria bacterium]|nr:hypothetical protein [Deltaproteobacteria bacterium]
MIKRLSCALAFAICALPTLARADEPAPAEVITDAARYKAEQGLVLFEKRDWKAAFEAFRLAEELFHAPSLVMRMATCQRELGHLLEARALYRRVADERLAADAPPAFRAAQADAKRELERLAKRIARLRVSVTGISVLRVNVKLDGALVPLEPDTVEVDPGDHRLEARAPGAEVAEQRIVVREGVTMPVSLRLEPLRQKVVVVTRGVGLAPGLVTLGLGVAGVATGAVTGAMALGQVADLEQRCGGFTCPTSALAERDRATTLATASTASFIAGGVGLAASALLLPLHFAGTKGGGAEGDAPKVSLGVAPFGGEVRVRW